MFPVGGAHDDPSGRIVLDGGRTGRAARYRYPIAEAGHDGRPGSAVLKFDHHGGGTTSHELGPDVVAGEAVFVGTDDKQRGENEGWLLTLATRRDGHASQLLVLDAADLRPARLRRPGAGR